MPKKATRDRGRPPLVTEAQLREAILAIRGREPTVQDLADHLGVARATLYSHVRGQGALRRLATDAILGTWRLPTPAEGQHWSEWAHGYAHALREKFDEYPVLVDGLAPQPGAQVSHIEAVVANLVGLGLDAPTAFFVFYALASLTLGTGTSSAVDRIAPDTSLSGFSAAVADTAEPLPHIRSLLALVGDDAGKAFPAASIFDALVRFTLRGIAAQRGESIPV